MGQPLMQAGETLNAIFFPNCRRTLRSYHSARFLLKIVTENCCPTSEICFLFLFWNLQRQFSDFSILTTILSQKLIIIDNWKPKNCVKNQILPKIGIMKLDKVVKSENWTKIGIENLSSLKIILHLTTVCFNGDFWIYLEWHSCLIESFVLYL